AGRASAAASTSDFSRDSLERLVDEATSLAKVTAEDPCAGLPDPEELIARAPDLDLEDTAGEELTPEQKVELARQCEAAALASDPSLYRRSSFLLDRLGAKIASPVVTIVDDPLIPGGLGSRPFDGEGLPTGRATLVGAGVLESYLLDTYSARKLGLTSTHHASRDGSGVSVSTSNLMLLPGRDTPEALIRSVKQGLYVTELIGFGVNSVTGDYSRGAAGLWIEGGELAYAVE